MQDLTSSITTCFVGINTHGLTATCLGMKKRDTAGLTPLTIAESERSGAGRLMDERQNP